MTGGLQALDDGSVAGCPLPQRTKLWEGMVKRRVHLQDVHCTESTKGPKRDRPDAAAEDEVRTATYRRKRRRVNQAGPNLAIALLPIMRHRSIDDTEGIIKTQVLSLIPPKPRVEQRGIQSSTSNQKPVVLDDGSPSPSTSCPSASAVDDKSPLTPFIRVGPKPSESSSDRDLWCLENATSRSSFPAAS